MSAVSIEHRVSPAHGRPGDRADATGLDHDDLLEHSSSVPLYFQLAEILKERIEAGRWRPGERISSERDITEEFGVSRTVIRPALDLLESDGQIIRVKGRGTFVSLPKTDVPVCGLTRLLREHRNPGTEVLVLSTGAQHADPSVITLLDAAQDDVPIGHCTVVIREAGKPIWMCTSFIATDRIRWLFPVVAAAEGGRIAAEDELGDTTSPQLLKASATISTAFVTEWEAAHLKMPAGSLCFLTRYIEHGRVSGTDRPLEFARIVHRADATQLTLVT